MTAPRLDRRTLNRTLLERQGLLRRERRPVLEVVEHLIGMQSQIPGNPFVALWSRIEAFDPAELDALMLERSLVRVGLMRTTLHLVAAEDALALRPLFAGVLERAFLAQRAFREGIAGVDRQELVRVGAATLESEPMTAARLRGVLAERWPDHDPTALAWAVRHLVPTVQVTPRGLWNRTMQPTMTTLSAWLGHPVSSSVERGLAEAGPEAEAERLVERYLRAFGPASVSDMRTWSWLTGLRAVVDRVRPRLRSLRDERGRELLDVADAPIVDGDVPAPIRFLPEYDNAFLSHDDRSRIAERWYEDRDLGRGAVLVDGFVRGGWRLVRTRGAATLEVDLFDADSEAEVAAEAEAEAEVEAEVEAEGSRLLTFLAPDAEPRTVEVRR